MSIRSTTGSRTRWLPWTVLLVASLLLLGSAAFVVSGLGQSVSPVVGGMMGNSVGNQMMGGQVWLAGNGTPVTTIASARKRAAEAAAPGGLHPGEVMQFSLNYSVELKDAAGTSVTEVLVDPAGGAVVTEYGPAMMWTSEGNAPPIAADRATTIANHWLQSNAPGETVDSSDLFPGHFTMDTVSGGKTVGMLSVNGTTGAAWYHTWHGTFIAKEDA